MSTDNQTAATIATAPGAPQVIVVDPRAQAQKQFIDELEQLKLNPPDRTIEGGYYLDADGRGAHDANGVKIPLRPEDADLARKIRATRPGGAAPEEETAPARAVKPARRSRPKKAKK